MANTVGANAIMGVLFMVVAGACAASARNIGLSVISIVGSIVAILRVIVLVRLRERLGGEQFDVRAGREAERHYGAIYLTFAGILGLFSALSLFLCPPDYHMTIAALAVGYGAGVAAGMSLRPRIAIPAIAMGTTPAILASIAIGSQEHLLLAVVLAALLAGGIRSILARYRGAVQTIELRHLFGSLARQDPLTGLANRFALEEALARIAEEGGEDGIVLHCFDLDRFKPVNDVHGHLVGDELLKAVAGRLKRLLRSGDLAVRLGGDEFAVLQTGIKHRRGGAARPAHRPGG